MEQFGLNWNDQRVGELIVILEELSRYEGREGEGQPDPLYKFVDLGYLDRLLAKRNHVLFGSRGRVNPYSFANSSCVVKQNLYIRFSYRLARSLKELILTSSSRSY